MDVIRETACVLSCLALSVLGAEALAQEEHPAAPLLGAAATDQVYTPVSPCRFVDGINAADRVAVSANGTTARYYRVRGNTSSDFVSQGAAASAPNGCGVPTTATAVAVNLTIADPDADGDIRADASHLAATQTSLLNFTFGTARGKNLANGAVVPLCDLSQSACGAGVTPESPTRDMRVTFHAGASAMSTYLIVDVVGYFTPANGFVASVTASTPLSSSGGTTPNISLSGVVGVAQGGTGSATLTNNGVLFGQGTSAVASAVGVLGQVLTGSAGAPVWTGSPSLSGSITLPLVSSSSVGNVFKGANPFIHNYGTDNTFLGVTAGNFTMTGGSNTASGVTALQNNSSGSNNTATGFGALGQNTTAGRNTALGTSALATQSFSNGNTPWNSENTAVGYRALFANQPVSDLYGIWNTAIGSQALAANTQGYANTASGFQALYSNTRGVGNTANGDSALYSNTTSSYNTASGLRALYSNTTGALNIAVGFQAGSNLTTGDYNIDIGNFGVAAEANTIRIGTAANQTRAFIAGIRGVTTGVANAINVVIDSAGQLGTVSSSRRVKDEIAEMGDASNLLMKLRPVTFRYKGNQDVAGRRLQYGLIAEEVAEVEPGLVAHSADGQIETVMYQFLPPMLLNEYQKQQRTNQAQAAEIERQAARIAELEQDRRVQAARIALLEQQAARVSEMLQRFTPTTSLASR